MATQGCIGCAPDKDDDESTAKLIGSSTWVFNNNINSGNLLVGDGIILALRTDALGQGPPDDFKEVEEACKYFNKVESPQGELIVFRFLVKKT